MDAELLSKYADLLLEVGVALKPGQNLKIACEPVHWDFANLLVERAYRAGARYVEPRLVHPLVSVHRANCSREEYLDYVSGTLSGEVAAMVAEEWAFLRLEGKENPDVFKNLEGRLQGLTVHIQLNCGSALQIEFTHLRVLRNRSDSI